MLSKSTAVAATLAFTLSATAYGAEYKVAAIQIDGLHQTDGGGLYDQVFSAINNTSEDQFSVTVMAPNRAFKDFEAGKYDCITPANTNPDFYQFAFETIASTAMTEAKVYLFTKKGSSPETDLSKFSDKKVGVRSGMPYGNTVENSGIKQVEGRTIEANIKKLAAGRIDAFLAYWPDVYAVFDSLGMEQLPHNPDSPVARHDDTLLCRTDKNGAAAVPAFNDGFGTLESNGELTRIFGE